MIIGRDNIMIGEVFIDISVKKSGGLCLGQIEFS